MGVKSIMSKRPRLNDHDDVSGHNDPLRIVVSSSIAETVDGDSQDDDCDLDIVPPLDRIPRILMESLQSDSADEVLDGLVELDHLIRYDDPDCWSNRHTACLLGAPITLLLCLSEWGTEMGQIHGWALGCLTRLTFHHDTAREAIVSCGGIERMIRTLWQNKNSQEQQDVRFVQRAGLCAIKNVLSLSPDSSSYTQMRTVAKRMVREHDFLSLVLGAIDASSREDNTDIKKLNRVAVGVLGRLAAIDKETRTAITEASAVVVVAQTQKNFPEDGYIQDECGAFMRSMFA